MFLDGLLNFFKNNRKKDNKNAKPETVEISSDEIEGWNIEDLLGGPLESLDDDDDMTENPTEDSEKEPDSEEASQGKEQEIDPLEDEGIEDFQKLEEALSAELLTDKTDSSDIDQEIAALLAQDTSIERKKAEELARLQNVDVHEISEKPDKTKNEKNENQNILLSLFDGMSMKTMYLIAGITLLLIILLSSIAFMFFAYESNKREQLLLSKGVLLSQPEYVSNNANFIYLNRVASFHGEDIVLVKMLIDPTATLFYFQQNLDVANLDFILEDEEGKLYGMDLTYMEYEPNEGGSVVRFEPLDLSVYNYNLTISDREESSIFPFKLDANTFMPPVKYLTTPQELLSTVPKLSLAVSGGTLSSSGSTVHFKMKWDDPLMQIQMGDGDLSDVLNMTESGRVVLPAQSKPLLYNFSEDNSVLGRMDFHAVKSLSGKLRITFKNLYQKIKVGEEVPTQGLFTNTLEGQQTLKIDKYNVVLERMGRQGDNIILVFHTQNSDIFAKSGSNEDSRFSGRVETLLDAELIMKTPSGMEIALKGKSTSGQRGTDMRFNTGMAQNFDYSDMVLKIDSLLVKMDPVSAEYDLDNKPNIQDSVTDRALNFVLTSFKERLAYKSGEISMSGIEGFSDEVLDNTMLMSNYEPVSGASNPSYSVQFVTYSMNDNELQGIVQELWKADVDGNERRIYRTHRVWATVGDMGWVITRDEIIG